MHTFKDTLILKMLPPLESETDLIHKALSIFEPSHPLNREFEKATRIRDIAVFGQALTAAEEEDFNSTLYVHRSIFEMPLAEAPLVISALAYLTSEDVFLDQVEVIDSLPDSSERTAIREDFIVEQELAFGLMRKLHEIIRQTER